MHKLTVQAYLLSPKERQEEKGKDKAKKKRKNGGDTALHPLGTPHTLQGANRVSSRGHA